MCTRHEPHNPHCTACLADAPRPAESIFDWRAWSGGEMPVPHGTLIDVEYRNGNGRVVTAGEVGAALWDHCGVEGDIVRYRLREPAVAEFARQERRQRDEFDKILSELATRVDADIKHSHYFKDVSKLQTVDVYRVLALFNVVDPCLQHAVKKLLVAGGRGGGKDISRDIQEVIDTLQRWQAMRAEEVVS